MVAEQQLPIGAARASGSTGLDPRQHAQYRHDVVVLRGTGLGIAPAVEAPLVGVEPDDHRVILEDMAPDPGQELGARAARPAAQLEVAAGREGSVVDTQQQLAALSALTG